GGQPCRRPAIESWTLLAPAPGGAGDVLVTAAAAIAPTTTNGGAVTFAPPLAASTERCTEPVALHVATRGHRPGIIKLRARTNASGVRPRDGDTLKLVCAP